MEVYSFCARNSLPGLIVDASSVDTFQSINRQGFLRWLKKQRIMAFAFMSYTNPRFYRAMHFSAKRGIAIACRLSVCL